MLSLGAHNIDFIKSNHMLSLGANNLPQFDEGNLLCVEFNNLNLKYLSISSNSLLASQVSISSE